MKQIKLTQGKFAVVSDTYFPSLNKFKWYAHFDGYNWYAQRRKPGPHGINVILRMHNEIIKCKKGQEPDHINGDSLDNRRCNLRSATHQQNVQNRFTSVNKGITRMGKKFRVRIGLDGRGKHLGMFDTLIQARHAYRNAAKKYFGSFARLEKQ